MKNRLDQCGSVLDVGCGIRPQQIVNARRYVGVDAHRPYLVRAQSEHPERVFICGRWSEILPRFMDGAFEVVVAMDFIEHLAREDGLDFLEEAQRVGRAVLIFTPLGPFPQSYAPGEPDAWGMDGGHWQTHRSAWTPEDFEGWAIDVLEGFHVTDAKGRILPEPIDAFFATRIGLNVLPGASQETQGRADASLAA